MSDLIIAIEGSFHVSPEETSFHFNRELGNCYFLAGQTLFSFGHVSIDRWVINLNTNERVLTYSNYPKEITEEEFFVKAAYYMSNSRRE